MPRRRRIRRFPRRAAVIKHSFTAQVRGGKTFLKFGQLGITAEYPIKVSSVNVRAVSNGTCALQIELYGIQNERIALSAPQSVGQHTVSMRVAAPPGTDFHLPANDENILAIDMFLPQTSNTIAVVSGVIHVQIRSDSVMAALGALEPESNI